MFYGCSSLKLINLSNFNTQNIEKMSWMFSNCLSLTNKNIITNNKKIIDQFFEDKNR